MLLRISEQIISNFSLHFFFSHCAVESARRILPSIHQCNARTSFCFIKIRCRHHNCHSCFQQIGKYFPKSLRETGSTPVVGSSKKNNFRCVNECTGEREFLLHSPESFSASRVRNGLSRVNSSNSSLRI